MPGNGKGSSWRHCRLVTSHHATWSCLLSVSNALSTAYLFDLSMVKVINEVKIISRSRSFQGQIVKCV